MSNWFNFVESFLYDFFNTPMSKHIRYFWNSYEIIKIKSNDQCGTNDILKSLFCKKNMKANILALFC